MRFFRFSVGMLVLVSMIFISCKKAEKESHASIRILFTHFVGDEEVSFDTIKYINAFGNSYSVSTLNYFISDFVLTKDDGSTVSFDFAHYVDAKNQNTLSIDPTTKVPIGNYNKISFVFGLNEERNISGAFPNPPENNMEWPIPMGGGYHYMKLEGKFDSVNLVKNYQAHTGRLMETPHFINIEMDDLELSVDGVESIIEIKMDINKWWENPNTLDLNTMSSIMGNEAKQQTLEQNGSDVFSVNVY